MAGLSPRAVTAIGGAEIVYGGTRHLALAASLITGEARAWPSPIEAALSGILAARGRAVCVLASGDPFFHGIGNLLARHVDPAEMAAIPAPSSGSLAAARLGWPLAEVAVISIHGRPRALLRPALADGARILVLTSDATEPALVAAMLCEAGFGASQVTLLEALGGPRERVRTMRADAFAATDVDPLNILAIACVAGDGAAPIPLTPGRDDALFAHDGQITKREVRAMVLAALAPRRGETLWDIGAGSGAVGIEWMLAHPSLRATAIEPREDRRERIARNAEALGTPGLVVVAGAAPAALAGLDAPDAIFIGGGGAVPGVLDATIAALKPGGRLVANAVTIETEALLLAHHAALGGSLTRIAIDRADAIGTMTGWRPAMPVTMWQWTRPCS